MHVGVAGVLDFIHRAHLDNAAVVKHRNTVGHLEGTHHVVRHHHRGHPELALHIENQVVNHVTRDGVQTGRRFIVQQDFRVQGNCAGQGNTLAHTARKFRRHLSTEFGHQVNHLEFFGDHILNLFLGKFRVMFTKSKRNILAGIHRVKKCAHLEKHTHLATDRMRIEKLRRTDGHAVHRHFAAIRLQQADHML